VHLGVAIGSALQMLDIRQESENHRGGVALSGNTDRFLRASISIPLMPIDHVPIRVRFHEALSRISRRFDIINRNPGHIFQELFGAKQVLGQHSIQVLPYFWHNGVYDN
jgi:hypothetical protein